MRSGRSLSKASQQMVSISWILHKLHCSCSTRNLNRRESLIVTQLARVFTLRLTLNLRHQLKTERPATDPESVFFNSNQFSLEIFELVLHGFLLLLLYHRVPEIIWILVFKSDQATLWLCFELNLESVQCRVHFQVLEIFQKLKPLDHGILWLSN